MISKNLRVLSVFLFFASFCAHSQANDVAGSSDHPLLERYPGSTIGYHEVNELTDYTIPLGPPKRISSRSYQAARSQTVRGRLTRLVYRADSDSSALQIHENYKNALSGPRFSVLHSCSGSSCEERAKSYARGMDQFKAPFKDKSDAYYLVATHRQDSGGLLYVVNLVGERNGGSTIVLDIIETKELELGIIKSNADALLDSLLSSGKAEIYDIFFDTGKASLKPESDGALSQIMEVLNRRPDVNLYVVGHTDDTGNLSINNKLSQERADAVVKALVARGVDRSDRLYAKGVGPFAPVASNSNDAGRAKNRRVELVLRLQQ